MRGGLGPAGDQPAADEGTGGGPLAWGGALARALVEHSADPLLVIDAEHRCLFASPAIRDRLGYAPRDVLGQNVIPLHHPADLPRAAAMLAAAAADPGAPARAEVRLRHAAGPWRRVEVVATNRLADPAVRGIVCNLRDVTERTEAALATEAALREQERLARARSEFLHFVAHEFGSPLAAIAGFAQWQELEPDDRGQVVESARTIRQEAARLARLVDDLLRPEGTGAAEPPRRERVDLNALVGETVARLRGQDRAREFRLELDPGLPAVDADPERLAQAVANLVGNAVKYSPAGEAVAVATGRAGASVRLSVADRGIGIPAGQVEAVFERYRRADNAVARGIPGTGLGLAIVREIVDRHGGRVWAESAEGRGSTFVVELPAGGAAPAAGASAAGDGVTPAPPPGGGRDRIRPARPPHTGRRGWRVAWRLSTTPRPARRRVPRGLFPPVRGRARFATNQDRACHCRGIVRNCLDTRLGNGRLRDTAPSDSRPA